MLVGTVMQVRIVMLASKDSNAGKEAVMLVRILVRMIAMLVRIVMQ